MIINSKIDTSIKKYQYFYNITPTNTSRYKTILHGKTQKRTQIIGKVKIAREEMAYEKKWFTINQERN